MRAGRADGGARTATGERSSVAPRSDLAPRCGDGRGGSAGRRGGDRRHAERCPGSPLAAPASNCQPPSSCPRAGTRRASAPVGFECPIAGTIGGRDVRTRLRTVEHSPSGHHSGRRYDTARAQTARARRQARCRRCRTRDRICEDRSSSARHLHRDEPDRELSRGQATIAVARDFPTRRLAMLHPQGVAEVLRSVLRLPEAVRWGTPARRAAGRPFAAASCAERTVWRSPAVTATPLARLPQPWQRHSEPGPAARAEAVVAPPGTNRPGCARSRQGTEFAESRFRASRATFVRRHRPYRRSPRSRSRGCCSARAKRSSHRCRDTRCSVSSIPTAADRLQNRRGASSQLTPPR